MIDFEELAKEGKKLAAERGKAGLVSLERKREDWNNLRIEGLVAS